jgi:dTDP-4-amino-4,6-dideoxygalactose transaminase
MTSPAPLIPYVRPTWDANEAEALLAVLHSGQWNEGPWIARLEAELAGLLGGDGEVVTVANGTLALFAVLRGLARGAERPLYVASSLDFAAGPACALQCGYDLALVDIDGASLNMSAGALDELLTRVRGRHDRVVVNPVLFAGRDDGLAEVAAVVEAHDAWLLEDACHAAGLYLDGGARHWRPAAASRASVLSFHPTKNVATGEGGAVFTRDRELAAYLRSLRSHNIDRAGEAVPELALTRGQRNPWFYEIASPGLNLRLSEFHAAIACVQLSRLRDNWNARLAIAARYRDAALHHERLRLFMPEDGVRSAYHLLPAALGPKAGLDRHQLFTRLAAANIRLQVHYVPLHRQPAFAGQAYVSAARFPVFDDLAPRLLSLPMYPRLSAEDQARVLAVLVDVLGDR